MGRFIDYSIGNNEYQVFTNTSSGTSVSTAGSIQYQTSVQIPSNSFTTGDIITVEAMLTKSATNGTVTPYFYIGTGETLSGATLIASGSDLATTTRSFIFYRRFLFTNSTTLFGSNTTTQANNDLGLLSGATSSVSYNNYIILAANHSSASDSVVGEWIKVSTF